LRKGVASVISLGGDGAMVNVTCESCHGRGSGHAVSGETDGISLQVPEGTCRSCHDDENSPYFDYEPYLEMGGAHRGAPAEQE